MNCSNNMCGKKYMFSKLDETFDSEVKFQNNTTVPIKGRGKISLKLKDRSQNFVVSYTLSLHHNLLTIKQILEKKDMQIYYQ